MSFLHGRACIANLAQADEGAEHASLCLKQVLVCKIATVDLRL